MPYSVQKKTGFTLIQLSVLVVIFGLFTAAIVPGGASKASQYKATQDKIAIIQNAIYSYMAVNGAMPCPAFGYTGIGNSNFGVAQASGTSCSASLLSSGNTFIGMVPVKSLGLPDNMAIDGFGRRFTYAIDARATNNASCQSLQFSNARGEIDVRTTSATSTNNKKVMWLILSHGFDGHGAFPQNGGADNNARFNVGSGMSDSDTLTNANVDSSFVASVDAIFVRKNNTTTFDDLLWTDPDRANTCCIGKMCLKGYKTSDNIATSITSLGQEGTSGDVNGDGYDDLILNDGLYTSGAYYGRIYIIFGGKAGVDTSTTPLSMSTNANVTISGDAHSIYLGFGRLASGDFNGDGIDDIALAGSFQSATPAEVFVVYGRSSSSWASTCNNIAAGSCTAESLVNNTNGFSIMLSGSGMDGYSSNHQPSSWFLLNANPTDGQVVSINGFNWTFKTTVTDSNIQSPIDGGGNVTNTVISLVTRLNTSTRPEISAANYVRSGNYVHVYYDTSVVDGLNFVLQPDTAETTANVTYGSKYLATNTQLGTYMASGDLNDDGIDDLAIGAPSSSLGDKSAAPNCFDNQYCGGVFVIFGGSWNWTSPLELSDKKDAASVRLDKSSIIKEISSTTPTPTLTYYYGIGSDVEIGDVNGDGSKDLLFYSVHGSAATGRIFVFLGPLDSTTSNIDATSASPSGYFIVNTPNETSGSNANNFAVGDINGDKIDDILIGADYASNVSAASVSTEGVIRILYGSSAIATVNMTEKYNSSDASSNTVYIAGGGSTRRIGGTLELADLDGDGIKDIITSRGLQNSGHVIYGKPTKFTNSNSITNFMDSNQGFTYQITDSASPGTWQQPAGKSPAVGNFNGDKYDDVMIWFISTVAPAPRRQYIMFGRKRQFFDATTYLDNY